MLFTGHAATHYDQMSALWPRLFKEQKFRSLVVCGLLRRNVKVENEACRVRDVALFIGRISASLEILTLGDDQLVKCN